MRSSREGKEIKGLLKGREEGSYFGEEDWDASKRKLNVISLKRISVS